MSKPRRYRAHVPVLITFRMAFGQDYFRLEEELGHRLRQLVARWAVECKVRVFGYALRTNHVHLIVSQKRNGHYPCRRKGIAPMMRNINSQLAAMVNEALGLEGRMLMRTYHSHNLPKLGDLLQQLSYIHHQDQHHRATDPCCADSRPVYELEMDGIVTAIPLIEELAPGGSRDQQIAALVALLAAIGQQALAIEERARQAEAGEITLTREQRVECARPWRSAARIIAKIAPVSFKADTPSVPLMHLRRRKTYRERREAHLRRPVARFATPQCGPAAAGSLIRVTVVRA